MCIFNKTQQENFRFILNWEIVWMATYTQTKTKYIFCYCTKHKWFFCSGIEKDQNTIIFICSTSIAIQLCLWIFYFFFFMTIILCKAVNELLLITLWNFDYYFSFFFLNFILRSEKRKSLLKQKFNVMVLNALRLQIIQKSRKKKNLWNYIHPHWFYFRFLLVCWWLKRKYKVNMCPIPLWLNVHFYKFLFIL